jgi:16S rRNA (uracil1498-N3)-methyltransferase
VVERVGRNEVELTALARESVDRELPFELTLGVALPKGDRQKWLVEKAVELGVTRIVPLCTQRGVAQPVDQALARLRRSVIEASKQCGRNRLLKIEEPKSWEEYLENSSNGVQDSSCPSLRLIAHPGAECRWDTVFRPEHQTLHPNSVLLAIGPEGGFTDEEASLAVASGWTAVDLGPRILRVETAALFLVFMATR